MIDEEPRRPRTRGECLGGYRPCPWVSCRHHLGVDVTEVGSLVLVVDMVRGRRGAVKTGTSDVEFRERANDFVDEWYDWGDWHPPLEVPPSRESCALDVADRGANTLDTVGELISVTRERTRQIEAKALRHMRGAVATFADDDAPAPTIDLDLSGVGE